MRGLAEKIRRRPIRPGPKAAKRRGALRNGISMVEMLIALAVLAVLLSSMAVAFHASLQSYEENDKIASATQSARSVLSRVTNHVRGAAAIELYAPSEQLTIQLPDDGSGDRQVLYFFQDEKLHYQEYLNGSLVTDQPLLGQDDGVRVVGFYAWVQTGEDWQGFTCAKCVQTTLYLDVDGHAFNMTVSTSPRRNQTY